MQHFYHNADAFKVTLKGFGFFGQGGAGEVVAVRVECGQNGGVNAFDESVALDGVDVSAVDEVPDSVELIAVGSGASYCDVVLFVGFQSGESAHKASYKHGDKDQNYCCCFFHCQENGACYFLLYIL